MVELRMAQREIVFRVFYGGDEGATKFATIRSLHESLCGDDGAISVVHAGGDRIVSFRHRPRFVEPLFGLDVSVEMITIPGPLTSPANAELLMGVADAVIYLDDRSYSQHDDVVSERFDAFIDALGGARAPGELPLFVQCYGDGPDDRPGLFERDSVLASFSEQEKEMV